MGEKTAEWSNIIHSAMDKFCPPLLVEAIDKVFTSEASFEQLSGKQSSMPAEHSTDKPVLERKPHRVTTTLLTTNNIPVIKEEPIESTEHEKRGKTISISSTSTLTILTSMGF